MAELTKKKLQTLDDLFGETNEVSSPKSNEVTSTAHISELFPFKKHPFKLYKGKRREDMVRSIKEFGILQPIIVRPYVSDIVTNNNYTVKANKYEILAGHNRWDCAREADLEEVPIIIMDDLSDEDAMLVVIETNLLQRSFVDLSYSERALILSEHYTALKSQGRRNDIINQVKKLLDASEINGYEDCGHDVHKSRDSVGEEYNIDGRTVARYIRINMLCDEIKKFIDEKEVSFTAGVDLSYLSEENQTYLVDFINNRYKVTPDGAAKLRKLQEQNKLTESIMESVLNGTYDKPKKVNSIFKSGVKLKSNVIKKYFTEQHSAKEVEETIQKALEMYFNRQDGKAD